MIDLGIIQSFEFIQNVSQVIKIIGLIIGLIEIIRIRKGIDKMSVNNKC